jgi:hypothetical protein
MVTVAELTQNARIVGPDLIEVGSSEGDGSSVFVVGSVADEFICQAEQQLGVCFPPEYRSFLASYGALLGRGLELAGVAPYEIERVGFFRSIVNQTREIRDQDHEMLGQYVAISDDGIGTSFLLDTKAREGSRIVARGAGIDLVVVAKSLDEFCNQMMIDTYAELLNRAQFLG